MLDSVSLWWRSREKRAGADPELAAPESGTWGYGRLAPWIVFAVALLLYGAGSCERTLWRVDELRYAEVAREMVESGDWLVPQLNGATYSHKPPGFFWIAAAGYGVLNLPMDRAVMLPSVLAAAATLAMTFALGRRLYGRTGAMMATLVLGSAEMFLSLGLRGNLDSLLTGFTTGGLALYYFGEESRGRSRLVYLGLAGLCVGLGILVKGPVAFAIPASIVLAHRLWSRGAGGLRDRALAIASVCALVPCLVWLLAVGIHTGPEYVSDLVWGHGVGHAIGRVDKLRPVWFYLKSFPAGFAPWIAVLPLAIVSAARQRELRFPLLWLVAPVVMLSLFPAKRHLYLAPVFPGAALVVACIVSSQASSRLAWLWSGGRVLLGLGGLLAVGLLAAPLLGIPSGAVLGRIPSHAALAVPSMMLIGSSALWLMFRARKPHLGWLACYALGAAALQLSLVHPLESDLEDLRPFYEDVSREIGAAPLYSFGGPEAGANLFLERSYVGALPTRRDAEALLADCRGTVFLVSRTKILSRAGTPAGWNLTWPDSEREVGRYRLLVGQCLASEVPPAIGPRSVLARRQWSSDWENSAD